MRESEARMNKAQAIAHVGSWELNLAENTLSWSGEVYRIFGLPIGSAPPSYQQFLDLVHPDDRSAVDDAYRESVRAGRDSYDVEHRVVRQATREIRYVREKCEHIRDASGTVVRSIGMVHDITESRLAEQALRERNQYIETILENAPIGFAVNRIDDGRIVFAGSKFEEIYGQPRGSLGSVEEFFEKVYPDAALREQVRLRIMADLATGDPARLRWDNIPVVTADGETRFVSATNIPLLDQNLMVSTVQDVTAHRRAEEEKERLHEQLAQAQKMESVGRLAGGVAHDFNNMLTVILGHAGLALDRVAPSDPVHADLAAIEKAAHRSADLTRRLLAFARRQTVAPRVLDLNATVSGMLAMLRRLIGEDIDLVWRPGADLGPVRIDPSQVDQILANLSVNARDAIPGAGRITIATRNAALDEASCASLAGSSPGEYVVLSVSDDGHGMGKEVLEHLFEPFFTTKGVGRGTGLGLATVYGIVRQNDGFIDVASEPGKGSTFTIYLPRHARREAAPNEQPAAAEPPASTGETVLLVEDEPAILRLAAIALRRLGYAVLTAGGPVEALERVRACDGPIQLVITDVVMPEMNGRELVDALARAKPGIKPLFMSGYTADVIAHRGVLDEGLRFLQKPFTIGSLATKVREALDAD